jgi:DNA-3-methyladenine glycosylase
MTRLRALPRSFYEPSAEAVAANLLGHWLVRNTPAGPCGGAIVETEAYLTGDEASHAFRGRTKRTAIMYGEGGYGYVYFIYGNHCCFNAVCQPEGIAEAVLVRAVEPSFGLEWMRERRPVKDPRQLTNGPGKLCEAMNIKLSHTGVDLCNAKSPVFIAENPDLKTFLQTRGPLVTTTRIGITRAAALPLRFYLGGSEFISCRVKTV